MKKKKREIPVEVREKPSYSGDYRLTVERVQWFLARHTIDVVMGNSRGYEPLVWWACLSDQSGYEIGEKPTGRGATPDAALLDLFRTLANETIALDYDFGRAQLTVLVPPFSFTDEKKESSNG